MEDLLTLCAYPPPADAVCRYTGCQQIKTYIYFSDPGKIKPHFVMFFIMLRIILQVTMNIQNYFRCEGDNLLPMVINHLKDFSLPLLKCIESIPVQIT